MPQRKNPAPQRLSEDELPISEQEPSTSQITKFPDDPKLLQEIPKESLYRENEIDSCIVKESDKHEDGKFRCYKCKKEYTTSAGLRYHLQYNCDVINRFRYTCLICGRDIMQLEEILNHISEKHLGVTVKPSKRRARRRLNKTLVEEELSGENDTSLDMHDAEEFFPEEESDVKDDDFDIYTEEKEPASAVKAKKRPSSAKKRATSSSSGSSTFATIQQPFHEVLHWVFEFLSPLEEKYQIVFPDFVPNFDKWVKNPNFDKSDISKTPPFVVTQEGNGFLYESEGLDPFGTFEPSNDTNFEISAGGPIQALSWCPISMKEYGSRQYLVVSTNCGLHSPDDCYFEQGLIQFWDCGVLNLHGRLQETPKFMYGISCDEAPIWELKWCRVGGRISTYNGEEPRIGILAAACASGKVLILAIPDLAASDIQSSGEIYRANPAMVLLPGVGEAERRERTFGQCLSVDWTMSDGGQWLAGGYSKGFVALWKLKDPSSMLLSHKPDGLHLIACRIFLAHNKGIRSICWCPFDDAILATGGQDRFLKLWNRNRVEVPIMVTQAKISTVTEISWPMLWCGVFTATDDVFAGPWNHGLLYQDVLTKMVAPYALIPFKSACLTLSHSNWMNCIVGGDSAGLAVIYAGSNWSRKVRSAKTIPRLRLFHTKVKWDCEDQENQDAQTFEKYQLTFHDTNLQNLKNIEKRQSFKSMRLQDSFPITPCDEPYVQAVARLAWNPNFGSHTWIASGLQCGLIRLQCVDKMHSEIMDNIFEDLSQKLS